MARRLFWSLSMVLGYALLAATASAEELDRGRPQGLGQVAEQICRSLKLRAASEYYACLLKTPDVPGRPSRCTPQFVRQFEQADRISPRCKPLDDLGRANRLVQSQTQAVLAPAADPPACATVTQSGTLVYCQLTTPGESSSSSSVVLSEIAAQLESYGVTTSTVLWLQAWGGNGGASHDYSRGGSGGFAQMITSISDLQNAGIVNLYFYLGQGGTHTGPSGGQGGAATIVTAQDLTLTPTVSPFQSMIILLAGGGGGSGGDSDGINGCAGEAPHYGGAGGVAISANAVDGQGIGPGSAASVGGQGGNEGVGGAAGTSGQSGQSGVGGTGGEAGAGDGTKPSGNPGWTNTTVSLTFTTGQGGSGDSDGSDCTAGGGAGGGGWGGGGGGAHGNSTTKAEGGGGGGSTSGRSTQSDANAPTSASVPANPNGSSGFVQLVFDLAPVSQQ